MRTDPALSPSSLQAEAIARLERGEALLPESQANLIEVSGILKSYGLVLDAYYRVLADMAERQFLVFLTFFKYFQGEVTPRKLLRHWRHDRLNYEYAEYIMRAMLWHGGGGLDAYLDSAEFRERAEGAIRDKFRGNGLMLAIHRLYREFLPEQVRQLAYCSVLAQFWQVMSELFLSLGQRYDSGEIASLAAVVQHIQAGLLRAANRPITYTVALRGHTYEIVPPSAGLTFLADAAVPYVEAILLRGTPFLGTVSYNAQAGQIPQRQSDFRYGPLYADPLTTGSAGVPPSLLAQDLWRYLPAALQALYGQRSPDGRDWLVRIGQGFQKAMVCVTAAAIRGLAPHPLETADPQQQQANRAHLAQWVERFPPGLLAPLAASAPDSTD